MSKLRIAGIIGEDVATATAVATFLDSAPPKPTICINSPGGNAMEGAAILAVLEDHGGVTVQIEGIAASAASLIAMGGQTIKMHPAALLMIHEPAAFTFGTATDHRESAETLDTMTDVYAAAYARSSGNSFSAIKDWMKDETWMSAEDALTLNFCDEIGPSTSPDIVAAAFEYDRFKNAPAHLKKNQTQSAKSKISLARLFKKGKNNA